MVICLKSRNYRTFKVSVCVAVIIAFGQGCRRAEVPVVAPAAIVPAVIEDLNYFKPSPIGAAIKGYPWITHVNTADLDQDGRIDVLACDAKANTVIWLRQSAAGVFDETNLATNIAAPVHIEAVDFDGDGDLDVLVAGMGQVLPNNEKIGSVVILENDGHQHFTKHVVLDNVSRVTDVRAGDFNGDGKLDLAVGQFGYDQGEIRWLENLGNWKFKSQALLSRSGTVNVCVADLNGDKTLDIVAVVSQEWEEIYLFENDGKGNFSRKIIYGSTNEDFGSSGISLSDLNRDGRPDILYTNGDGFDYAAPGARPWHGVQWLENLGQGTFRFHRVGDLPGAYSPIGVDIDEDGAIDIMAVSGFNDWANPMAASLVMFHNDGKMNFTMHVLAHSPTHLVSCAAADLDGNGRPVLVTAGFHAYPPFDRLSRLTLWWRQTGR